MADLKEDIIKGLTDKGIEHDPNAPKGTLKALLDTHTNTEPVEEDPVDPNAPEDPRKAAWEAYLVTARAKLRDTVIFDAQKARGEFDKIPDNFIG